MVDCWGSVIGTVRREPRERLQRMVDHIASQSVEGPVELVLAGPSEDRAVVESLRTHGALTRIVFVDNPGGARSPGLNLAARAAGATHVHRVDARSLLRSDHLLRCDRRLTSDPTVGVVGGRQRPVALTEGTWARGMARALANPWLLGAPAYRRVSTGADVDTVYLGSYRREELLGIGGFDERLEANEDYDLCQRYRESGALVWLEHGLVVDYEARSRLVDVWRQYHAFGRSKVTYWRVRAERPNVRQAIGLAAPIAGASIPIVLARRPGALAGLAVAGAAGVLTVDAIAGEETAPPAVRASATIGNLVIPLAWASGAYREFLARPT